MHLALDLVVVVVAPLEPQAPRDRVRLETEGGVLGRQPVQPRVCALEGTLDLHHSLGPHQAVRGGRQEALVCVHKEAALLHLLAGFGQNPVQFRQGELFMVLTIPLKYCAYYDQLSMLPLGPLCIYLMPCILSNFSGYRIDFTMF